MKGRRKKLRRRATLSVHYVSDCLRDGGGGGADTGEGLRDKHTISQEPDLERAEEPGCKAVEQRSGGSKRVQRGTVGSMRERIE